MTRSSESNSRPGESKLLSPRGLLLALALLMLLAFGLRMIDLTDAPLDFHPTRQYRGALIARSIYYQLSPAEDPQEQARALADRNVVAELEPPILESLVALGYLVAGGEQLWIARIINSLFWLLGGWALYHLARRYSTPLAALLALAYFLFLPFAVSASRSFQPDPLMVTLIALTALAATRWAEERTWKWTVLAGLAAGASVLVKAVAFYYVGGILLAIVLSERGLREALREWQVWGMAALAILLPSLYYLPNVADAGGSYIQNWVIRLLPIAYDGAFYVRWLNFLGELFGLTIIALALIGVLLAGRRYRALLVGLWAGYVLYGITLPHQTLTHNYYHLPLTLIVALSLAPLLAVIVAAVARLEPKWHWAFAALLLAAITFNGWLSRSNVLAEDHRAEIAYWERVGAVLPTDGKSIGLVQHYGHLLNYYGQRNIALWPVTSEIRLAALRGNDMDDFEAAFLERTAGMDYFLVTTFNQLSQQTLLEDYLNTHFAILDEGAGYRIYDLRMNRSPDS